ncbi:MAG: hypothetical protein ABI886_14160 [Betaproteobacteria bacterium]
MSTWQAVGRLIAGCSTLAFAAVVAAAEPAVPGITETIALPPSPAIASPLREKSYTVGGALTLVLPITYNISNPDGTVELKVGRLQNDSAIYTSGTINLRLFVTPTPIDGPFSYYTVGDYTLSPLPPNSNYDSLDVTVPLQSVPDGIYYVYMGAFEFENSCGSSSGYCADDYFLFTNRLQVSGGVWSFYTPPGATATAVEYYWASRDHYFFSTNPVEIAALDASVGGWVRTGYTFRAYATPVSGSSPVCRFYIPPAYGDSHFYSASPTECADTHTKFPVLVYESPNVTYVFLPNLVTGVCPLGTTPVYRLWNNRADSNHRYTTSVTIRDQMVSRGYVAEGYGPENVSACAPL